jgi:hypothetical protein
MAKVDRLLAWMSLLSSLTGSTAQRYLCDAIEKRYPIILTRARPGDLVSQINEQNTRILLNHLELLEQEEN